LFGSLAAFSAFVFLMQNTTPTKASTYAFVNPIVAVLLGWSIAGEPLDARSLIAIVIIVGAVMLITIFNPKPIAGQTKPAEDVFPEVLAESGSCQ
jgi:drug/metabolite transporter (DMT)-like permease